MVEHVVDTPDGRRLQVLEDGDPRGTPMLAHNGTPNCRRMPSPVIAKATARGIRLISYDRPGYGGSSRRPNRTVADCCDDVIAIASTLGLERLPVWGISGGGPHALACAALLPELVPAVGVIASGAPWDADGLDYLAGMGELNAEDIRLIISDKAAARAKCEADRLEALALEADDLAEYLQTLLAPVDREQLTPELAQYLVTTTREGLAPGADGWWDDNVAELGPGVRARRDPHPGAAAPRPPGPLRAVRPRGMARPPHSRRAGRALRRGRPPQPARPDRPRVRLAARARLKPPALGPAREQEIEQLIARGLPLAVDAGGRVAEQLHQRQAADRGQHRGPAGVLVAAGREALAEDQHRGGPHGVDDALGLGCDHLAELGVGARGQRELDHRREQGAAVLLEEDVEAGLDAFRSVRHISQLVAQLAQLAGREVTHGGNDQRRLVMEVVLLRAPGHSRPPRHGRRGQASVASVEQLIHGGIEEALASGERASLLWHSLGGHLCPILHKKISRAD